MQEWKPIKGYEGRYEVSNEGEVRSLGFVRLVRYAVGWMKGRVLKGKLNGAGYHQVFLSSSEGKVKVHRLHRIVADHFLQPDPTRTNINHKDGVRTNNHVDNLEWVTLKENSQHAFLVLGKTKGMYTPIKVSVEKDGRVSICPSMSDAARNIGCKPNTLTMSLRRTGKYQDYKIKAI